MPTLGICTWASGYNEQTMRQHASPWLLLSAGLHFGAGAALLTVEPARATRPFAPLELEVIVTAAPPRQPAPPPRSDEPPTAPVARERPVRNRRPRTSAVPLPTPPGPHDEAQPASDAPPASPSAPSSPRAPSLTPRAAALTLLDTGVPGGELAPSPAPSPAPSASERLNEAIAKGAARKIDHPPDPVLKRGKKGGYVFSGNGFDATIDPNGDLHIKDRYGAVHIPLVPFQSADGSWHFSILGGSVRLYEWLDRKIGKNDPYYSERRWFLERTRELRERLAREHAPRVRSAQPR